jgi:MarR family transcriptional regulator, lower aerobic nicotinate degradation pathway regulator
MRMTTRPDGEACPAADVDMRTQPGHLIRRAHQLHDALWASEVSKDVTPTQFAVLTVVAEQGRCDQATIAREASLDTSTAGAVVFRLVKRGWLRAGSDTADRRRNVLQLTGEGERLFMQISASAAAMTDHLVEPLAGPDRKALVALLAKLIDGR